MVKTDPTEALRRLFKKWANTDDIIISPLPQAGSYRQYYRITGPLQVRAIGVYSPDKAETQAFIEFTNHFKNLDLNVPVILETDLTADCYLITDLGNESLFDHLEQNRKNGIPSEETCNFYKQAIAALPGFQVDACEGFNFSACYPSDVFDERSMRWDLNYFKYYFLRLLKIPFNENELENDFDKLISYLLESENRFFMYRDFQARNILIHGNKTWFIDYQGGRRGPLQYDLASLLFQVKAQLPYNFREEMLNWYLENLRKHITIDEKKFIEKYHGFVLIRLLQVMGAYGFRGYFERRAHFLQSIPYAIDNLRWFLTNIKLNVELPELTKALEKTTLSGIPQPSAANDGILNVSVNSFSFKYGPPTDYTGNGGGFVFDCRALPNPGRYEQYKKLTGMDDAVIQFLVKEPAVDEFLSNIYKIIDQSINEYQQRKFSHLQVNFGCTGGQHRSVYCASKLAGYLKAKHSVIVTEYHQEMKNLFPA